jgi:histidinol-phosphate aminotransferase
MTEKKKKITPSGQYENIPTYISGAHTLKGHQNVLKLSANENLNGPSEKVKSYYKSLSNRLFEYPESDHYSLRQAISNSYGINADKIFCGAGSDEIIQLLCRCFCRVGEEVIYTEHGFLMYKISAIAAGAVPVKVPENGRTASVDNILKKCSKKTRIVFLANPNNPTGTMIGLDEIERLRNNMPPHTLLVLDGAYVEYVDYYDGGLALAEKFDNIFLTRTFSKIYGLGGLRVGWGYGSKEIVKVLNSVRSPFNVSSVALITAKLSVMDRDFVKVQRALNKKNRDALRKKLINLGIDIDKSFANFLLLRFSDRKKVEKVDNFLKSNGIIARRVESYGLPESLRLTIATEKICNRVYLLLKEILG